MSRRAKGIAILLVVVAVTSCALLWQSAEGPVYQGHRTVVWVKQSLHDKSRSTAFEAVLQIGAPAVPYVARQGLHNKYHRLYFY